MRILTITAVVALPLLALGQTTEPQQTQGQTKETQTTAPTKGKKMRPAQEQSKPQAKPETGANVRGQHESDERKPIHEGERARVQVASQRSVQSWAASEGVLRPTFRGEPFPADREHVLRVRGRLL